jgi:formylglycine-generating enzyme required for sulfatase activity
MTGVRLPEYGKVPPQAWVGCFLLSILSLPAAGETGMCRIPGGEFSMGDHYGQGWRDEQPVHRLHVGEFLMDKYEATNEDVRRVMQWALDGKQIRANAVTVRNVTGQRQELLDIDDWSSEITFEKGRFLLHPGRGGFPCGEITWYGALAYCNFRSEMEGLETCIDFADWSCAFTNKGYRLPTEAEWEKAARGGLTGHHYPWKGAGKTYRQHFDGAKANYWGSGDPFERREGNAFSSPVGYYAGKQKPRGRDMANGYGLYDMAGNVWEWCWDRYDPDWYTREAATVADTSGPASGSTRVRRGGSWLSGNREAGKKDAKHGLAWHLRCANRADCEPGRGRYHIGFRCVRRP